MGKIYRAARDMNAVIARELNTCLLHIANKDVIFGLEESRIGMDGGIEDRAQEKVYEIRIVLIIG